MTATEVPTTSAVRVARSAAEVEALRPLWEAAGPEHLDQDLDYFLTIVASAEEVRRPHVIVLERPGATPVVVVARLVDEAYRLRLGYRTLLSVRGATIVVSFDGIIGAGPGDHARVAAVLRDQLAAGEASAVLFQKLEPGASMATALESTVPGRSRVTGAEVVRWSLALPPTFDDLMAARPSKSRQRIRRELATFRRDHEGARVVRLDRPEDAERFDADVATVTRRSYQHALGVGGATEDPVLTRLRTFARERGWLRSWMLYVDDAPAAFWWGVLYRGDLAPGSTGYDPAHARSGAGFFTMMAMFEDGCADPDMHSMDFGFGDADYKQRFATDAGSGANVWVFGRRPGARVLRGVIALQAALDRLVALVDGTDWARSLKKRLRSRAVRSAGRGA